jgi:hypothetical protein
MATFTGVCGLWEKHKVISEIKNESLIIFLTFDCRYEWLRFLFPTSCIQTTFVKISKGQLISKGPFGVIILTKILSKLVEGNLG